MPLYFLLGNFAMTLFSLAQGAAAPGSLEANQIRLRPDTRDALVPLIAANCGGIYI
jgi:hypothetical protein